VIRVLFVCPNLRTAGAERQWSMLLPRLPARGIEPRVLTLDDRGPIYERLRAAGVPAACAAELGGPARAYPAALRHLRRHPADVVVTRATSAHGLVAAAARESGAVWAANWHEGPGLALKTRRRGILHAVLRRADAVLAVSPSQRAQLSALGVAGQRVTVIENGTDFRPLPAKRAATRAALALGAGDVAVVLVGSLYAPKRVDVFLAALAAAGAGIPQLVGLVVGDGPDRRALEAQAGGMRVRFLGQRDDVPELLAAADVLCLTSDAEASPLVVLEAMASGLPVVATAVGGVPGVVVDGVTGRLVPRAAVRAVAEALADLARAPARRRAMGEAGRRRQGERYTADAMADGYARTFVRLAHSKPQ
jgi:glycosyltransferase involved in cell wall biosynthesis